MKLNSEILLTGTASTLPVSVKPMILFAKTPRLPSNIYSLIMKNSCIAFAMIICGLRTSATSSVTNNGARVSSRRLNRINPHSPSANSCRLPHPTTTALTPDKTVLPHPYSRFSLYQSSMMLLHPSFLKSPYLPPTNFRLCFISLTVSDTPTNGKTARTTTSSSITVRPIRPSRKTGNTSIMSIQTGIPHPP